MFMSDVSIIVRKMRLIAEQRLGGYGIGFPEQLVLMYLAAHGSSNQVALADEFEIDKGSIAKTVSKLEEKGLVRREENPQNRREKRLELTSAAGEILTAMRCEHASLDSVLFAGLSDDERETTCRTLNVIAGNLVKAEEELR